MTDMLRRRWILVRRDLVLHRSNLLIAALIFTMFEAYMISQISSMTAWLVFTCIYASFLTIIPLNRDDKCRATGWICTFPVTRAEVVEGRYITAWTLAALLLAVCVVLAALFTGPVVSVKGLLQIDRLLLVAGIVALVLSLLLPLTIRFGFTGVILMLVVLQIAGALLFLVSRLTGSMDRIEGGIGVFFGALASLVVGVRGAIPLPLYYLVVVLVLIGLTWASYRFSVVLFRRREL
jgi:hypothetical protein